MPLLFAATLFVSASLLFMVQPMVGKMILPLLGGSPAVWNACMVFFQALLLLGYLYAHFVSTRLTPKQQWGLHTLVLFGPILAMGFAVVASDKHTPITVADGLAPSGTDSPFLSAMALLAVAIGVPFFVSSTSAPLLQRWFAHTGHPSARDPYFLYAASNAGSLISLLGYPLLIEPTLLLGQQAWLWAIGFVGLFVLIVWCGRAAANPLGVPPGGTKLPGKKTIPTTTATELSEPTPSPLRIVKWVLQAFVPSSFMLAVTFYMTTDIASIPLLWVIPLALYLVTFIIAYSTIVPRWFRLLIGNLAPVMMLLCVFVIVSNKVLTLGTSITLVIYISTFFAAALMCHYELALDRPRDIRHLTGYFLWISVGGVLGGIFNALVAPVLFTWSYEFPITLVIACWMVPKLIGDQAQAKVIGMSKEGAQILDTAIGAWANPLADVVRLFFREIDKQQRIAIILDLVIPILMGLVFVVLSVFLIESEPFMKMIQSIATSTTLSPTTITALALFAAPVMACFFFVDRPTRFALSVAALLVVHYYFERDRSIVYTERSFFGILKVEENGKFTRLVHGTTLHGTQINQNYILAADAPVPFGAFGPWDSVLLQGSIASWGPRQEPLTYYHRTGPVGAMFQELRTRKNGADKKADVAMVGLGTGSVSCYALPGQKLDFYEIDPAVKKLVADRDTYFTYVRDAENRGAILDFKMGDARLKLKENVGARYSLLLVDAFSSDSIPVHLLTKQSVELYLDRMAPDGLLALHISNKFVRLEPVVAGIVRELNLAARVWNDDSESLPGKTASSWVIVARDEKTLGSMAARVTDQIQTFGTKNQAVLELLRKYPVDMPAKEAISKEWTGTDLAIEEFARQHTRQTAILLEKARRYEAAKETLTLGQLAELEYGKMFRPLRYEPNVRLWTDDYTDVLQVMMIKEVQWARRQFGFTTASDDE